MNAKLPFLLLSHLLALGLGYGVARKSANAAERTTPGVTKLSDRERLTDAGDGDDLLIDFMKQRAGKHSRYEELKATLPVAKDLKGAVVSAIDGLGGGDWRDGLTEAEQESRLAEVEVRVLHWMKRNPVEAMGFILNDPACEAAGLAALLDRRVFRELAKENGVLKSLGWLAKNEASFGTLCELTLDEMKAGGGLAFFTKFQAALARHPDRAAFRAFRAQPLVSNRPEYDGENFFRLAGGRVRFEERDALLEFVRQRRDGGEKMELLSGFARTSGPAAGWLLDRLRSGNLTGIVAEESLPELNRAVLESGTLDLEQRLQLLRADPATKDKPRQELVNGLVSADVVRLLEEGRDWRFEFRNGKASAAQVLAAMRDGLAGIPEEGEETLRVTLYRQLAEEDPKRALVLLDSLPGEKRREALFQSTWLSHLNVAPDHFLRFLADVPDARTPAEQELKIKGWNSKARGFLWRYGDDYVEWVKAMPPGIHKETALNSIIWATAERDPAKARALSAEFYPPKP